MKPKQFIAANTIPDRRTGEYLLIMVTGSLYAKDKPVVSAFGLSTKDAVRASRNGATFLDRDTAQGLIAQVRG